MLVGARNEPKEIAEVLDYVSKASDPALKFAMTRMLGDGLQRARKPLTSAGDSVKTILAAATMTAGEDAAPDTARVPAIQLGSYRL